MVPRRSTLERDDGFTLFEVLIAAVVLIIGLTALFGLLDTSVKASAATRAREGGTSLAREILEDARTLAYPQMSPNSIVGQLQAMHGLENQSGGATWQIVRRGVTYTVALKECAIDDPKDGYGKHENSLTKENSFCKDPGEQEYKAGEAVQDPRPENLKRITAEVTWPAIGRKPVVKQVETLTAAGESPGLSAGELKLITPTLGAGNSQTAPVIVAQPIENKVVFSVQSPSGTKAMEWALDGVRQTPEPTFVTGTGTEWRFSWFIPLSEVSDGAYQVSVQAVDATGVYGPPISITVTLIRSTPVAPKITYAGFNEIYVAGVKQRVAELQWQANTERNIIGYRVYSPSPAKLVCPQEKATLSLAVTCIDFNPPEASSLNLTYSVVALYRPAEGEALSKTTIAQGPAGTRALSKTPLAPGKIEELKAKKNGEGAVVLKWTPPEGGAPVVFYRIYRGSINYTSRYAIVSPVTREFTDTDTETAHRYWVTAVSESMTESPLSPLVGWVEL